jgi:hypothetical protein
MPNLFSGRDMKQHILRSVALSHVVTLTAFSIVACSPGPTHKTVVVRPVTETAPYWCQLIPQQAVRDVTGITEPLTQENDIRPTDSVSACEVGSKEKLPLEVELALSAEAQLRETKEFSHNKSQMELPSNLGRAIFRTAPDAPNFAISSAFHCGGKLTWLSIVIRPVRSGRDPRADLPALLSIAEKRYAELARCGITQTAPSNP